MRKTMKFLIFAFATLTICLEHAAVSACAVNSTFSTKNVGEPLYLTELLEKGLIAEAKQKAWVDHPQFAGFDSYSGLFTVTKEYNSNVFFWFFPSQRNYVNDPVILWFSNEPAGSCLHAVFNHNGPLSYSSKTGFAPRNYSLSVNHSVIYMDVIGTGFSCTDDVAGYARNQVEVARYIIHALTQFYQLFPELQRNAFYVGGNAFGAQYAISIAKLIDQINDIDYAYINLKGVLLGNPLLDASYQKANADFLYQFGLLDKKQRNQIKALQEQDRSLAALTLEKKITGFSSYDNILNYKPTDQTQYVELLDNPSIRRALHVGNLKFESISTTVTRLIGFSLYKSMQRDLESLLVNYKVLVFNGQMDFLFPYVTSQELYNKLKWPFALQYKLAQRKQWWLDGQLAGYVKTANNFEEVLLRNSGHVTFVEQPKWSCELITRFTRNSEICQETRKALNYVRVFNFIPF